MIVVRKDRRLDELLQVLERNPDLANKILHEPEGEQVRAGDPHHLPEDRALPDDQTLQRVRTDDRIREPALDKDQLLEDGAPGDQPLHRVPVEADAREVHLLEAGEIDAPGADGDAALEGELQIL